MVDTDLPFVQFLGETYGTLSPVILLISFSGLKPANIICLME
jgi:hypothetical protein